jgi:hypothetical protein
LEKVMSILEPDIPCMIARRSILQHRLLLHIYACSAILSESLIIRAHELIEVLHIQLAV